jgi:hypothetical protein
MVLVRPITHLTSIDCLRPVFDSVRSSSRPQCGQLYTRGNITTNPGKREASRDSVGADSKPALSNVDTLYLSLLKVKNFKTRLNILSEKTTDIMNKVLS